MKPFFCALACLAPLFAQSAADSFDVASVKPNKSGDMSIKIMMQPGGRFSATNVDTRTLIRIAYNVEDFQIMGAPSWISSDRYDVEAKGGGEDGGKNNDRRKMTQEEQDAMMEQRRHMLQGLLAERFQLKLHKDSKEAQVYALVAAKGGPKLKELPPATEEELKQMGDKPDASKPRRGMMRMGPGELNAQGVKLTVLVNTLSQTLGRKVMDETGLKGEYDINLKWTPDEMREGAGGKGTEGNGPSIFTALQEQLGLKLESQKAQVEMLAIDHIEKPTEN